jgi:hypothetical protein
MECAGGIPCFDPAELLDLVYARAKIDAIMHGCLRRFPILAMPVLLQSAMRAFNAHKPLIAIRDVMTWVRGVAWDQRRRLAVEAQLLAPAADHAHVLAAHNVRLCIDRLSVVIQNCDASLTFVQRKFRPGRT